MTLTLITMSKIEEKFVANLPKEKERKKWEKYPRHGLRRKHCFVLCFQAKCENEGQVM